MRPSRRPPASRVPAQAALGVAAPVAALAVLGAADLLLGGNAHLTRSVLEAGGLDQLADVAERRLRLSAGNFNRYAATPLLWICALVIVAGIASGAGSRPGLEAGARHGRAWREPAPPLWPGRSPTTRGRWC